MRQLRRVLAALTLIAVLATTSGIAAANFPDAAGTRFAAATTRLMHLGILVGDPDGNFYPARDVTRAEMVKMVISARGLLHQVTPLTGSAAFPDTGDHWASGFIALAKDLGIVDGFPDGTFKPQERVTYVQAAKMLLEATGNEPDPGFAWPDNYMRVALAKNMFQGIPTTAANVPAIRGDCAMMAARAIDAIANPLTGLTLAQSVFGSIASLTVTPAGTARTPAGAAIQFTATPKDSAGRTIAGLPVGWMTSNPANVSLSQGGLFNSPVPGTYILTVASGGLVETLTVGVFGTATALRATPSATHVSATGAATVSVAVEVIDAAGSRVANNNSAQITMAHSENNGAVTLGATTLTAQAGLATFEVTSTTNDDRTDTIEFTAAGLTKAVVTISTVTQVATSIELSASPAAVQANSITSTLVTAQILDQSGQQMAGGAQIVTFSLSGPGTFAAGSTAPLDAVATAGEVSMEVFSVQAAPGTILVTASAEGLPNALLTINSYLAGSATALRANVADATVQSCSVGLEADQASLTVELVDASGNPTSKTVPVTLTAALADGAALSSVGLAVGGDMAIGAGETGTAEIVVRAAGVDQGEAGEHLIKLTPSDPSLAPITVAVTVSPGEPASLEVSHPSAVWLPVVNPVMVLKVRLSDAAGNDIRESGREISAGWSDLGGANQGKPAINGVLNPPQDPASDDAVVALTGPAGEATFTFAPQGYVGDDYQLTFRHEGLSVASGSIGVVDNVAAAVEIKFVGIGGPLISQLRADRSQLGFVDIVVRDGNGNPVSGWDVTIEFPEAGVNVQDIAVEVGTLVAPYADGTLTLRTLHNPGDTTHGMVSVAFRAAKAATAVNVTATVNGLATALTTAAPIRLVKGTAVAGVITETAAGGSTESLDVAGDTAYGLRLVPVDNGGNPITAPVDVKVLVHQVNGLYSTGTAGQFRETATGSAIAQGAEIVIPRGQAAKLIYYVQPAAEDAIEIGLDPGDEAYTAYRFAPTAVLYSPGPPESYAFTFKVEDGSGNPAIGLRLKLSTTAGTTNTNLAATDANGQLLVIWTGGLGGELRAEAVDAVLGGGGTLELTMPWGTP